MPPLLSDPRSARSEDETTDISIPSFPSKQHPNEYIRGTTLRAVQKIHEAELLEPLVPTVRSCLVRPFPYPPSLPSFTSTLGIALTIVTLGLGFCGPSGASTRLRPKERRLHGLFDLQAARVPHSGRTRVAPHVPRCRTSTRSPSPSQKPRLNDPRQSLDQCFLPFALRR